MRQVAPASKNNPYVVVTSMPPSRREALRTAQKLRRRSGKVQNKSTKK